jgi:hypothetical protein
MTPAISIAMKSYLLAHLFVYQNLVRPLALAYTFTLAEGVQAGDAKHPRYSLDSGPLSYTKFQARSAQTRSTREA